jgi:hypothetical protein
MRDLERRPSLVGLRSGPQRASRFSPTRGMPSHISGPLCRMVSQTAARARSRRKLKRTTPPTHTASIARFLSSQVNPLAEDKRFELLRVSPTRFPILLLAVRCRSGTCVTRHDGTGRTVPAAAELPRMRRKLRRTDRHSTRQAGPSQTSAGKSNRIAPLARGPSAPAGSQVMIRNRIILCRIIL